MIKRYDSMVLRLFVPGLAIGIPLIGLILVYTQAGSAFNLFYHGVISTGELIYLITLLFSQVLGYVCPLLLLLTGMWLVYRLLERKELLIFQILGLQPLRLIMAFIATAAFCTAIILIYMLLLMPETNRSLRESTKTLSLLASRTLFDEGKFKNLGDGRVLFIRELTGERAANGIFYVEKISSDKGGASATLMAKNMRDENDRVLLNNGHQIWEKEGKRYILSFDRLFPDIIVNNHDIFSYSRKPNEMSISELNQRRDNQRYNVEFHRRFSEPLLNLSMAMTVALLLFINPASQAALRRSALALTGFGLAVIYAYITLRSYNFLPYVWLWLYIVPALPVLLVGAGLTRHYCVARKKTVTVLHTG